MDNGHIAQIKIRINDNKLIEVMSSPVSNLTGINNLTADKIKTTPKQFPEPNAIDIPNLKIKICFADCAIPQILQYTD